MSLILLAISIGLTVLAGKLLKSEDPVEQVSKETAGGDDDYVSTTSEDRQ